MTRVPSSDEVEELKAKAKAIGYRLVKINNNIGNPKILPCVCGSEKRNHLYTFDGNIYIKCKKCKREGEGGINNYYAIRNWNRMVKEENEKSKSKI